MILPVHHHDNNRLVACHADFVIEDTVVWDRVLFSVIFTVFTNCPCRNQSDRCRDWELDDTCTSITKYACSL